MQVLSAGCTTLNWITTGSMQSLCACTTQHTSANVQSTSTTTQSSCQSDSQALGFGRGQKHDNQGACLCTPTICNACNMPQPNTQGAAHIQRQHPATQTALNVRHTSQRTHYKPQYITQNALHARLPRHLPLSPPETHVYHNTNSTTAPAATACHNPRLPLKPLPAALFTPVGFALSPPAGAASFPVPSLLFAAVPCCCGRVWTSGVEDASLPGTAVPCWGGWSQPAGTCMGCWPEGPDVA